MWAAGYLLYNEARRPFPGSSSALNRHEAAPLGRGPIAGAVYDTQAMIIHKLQMLTTYLNFPIRWHHRPILHKKNTQCYLPRYTGHMNLSQSYPPRKVECEDSGRSTLWCAEQA